VADVYRCRVEWDGVWTQILVETAETDALAGLKLLKGFHVELDFVEGARFTMERLD
jgi:predicted aspartyl protease